jgi:hypothetical protein
MKLLIYSSELAISISEAHKKNLKHEEQKKKKNPLYKLPKALNFFNSSL